MRIVIVCSDFEKLAWYLRS